MELLRHTDYLRILMTLKRRPLRFTSIQKAVGLNPAQVDRALTFLRKGLWIIPRTIPTDKESVRVEYSLGKRGEAFLDSFEAFRANARRHAVELGRSEIAELQSISA